MTITMDDVEKAVAQARMMGVVGLTLSLHWDSAIALGVTDWQRLKVGGIEVLVRVVSDIPSHDLMN